MNDAARKLASMYFLRILACVVGASRAPVFSCARYFQAPATQAMRIPIKTNVLLENKASIQNFPLE